MKLYIKIFNLNAAQINPSEIEAFLREIKIENIPNNRVIANIRSR